jgi:hypothetical protein
MKRTNGGMAAGGFKAALNAANVVKIAIQ